MENNNLKKSLKFEIIYRCGKKIIKFGDIGIENQKFYWHKRPISVNNIDIVNK